MYLMRIELPFISLDEVEKFIKKNKRENTTSIKKKEGKKKKYAILSQLLMSF